MTIQPGSLTRDPSQHLQSGTFDDTMTVDTLVVPGHYKDKGLLIEPPGNSKGKEGSKVKKRRVGEERR